MGVLLILGWLSPLKSHARSLYPSARLFVFSQPRFPHPVPAFVELCEHAAQKHGLASQIFIDQFFERFRHLCGRISPFALPVGRRLPEHPIGLFLRTLAMSTGRNALCS